MNFLLYGGSDLLNTSLLHGLIREDNVNRNVMTATALELQQYAFRQKDSQCLQSKQNSTSLRGQNPR